MHRSGHPPAREKPRHRFQDGRGLEPLQPLFVTETETVDQLLRAMARTSFGGRALGEAADVLTEMAEDDGCFVVGTFSGAVTAAKMGALIGDMIDAGIVDAVVCTGAIATHALVEELGFDHYKCPPDADDYALYQAGYDRIYDTLELELSLDRLQEVVNEILDGMPRERGWGSYELCARLGQYLHEHGGRAGFVRTAYRRGVPVFLPAFTDCELGLDVATYNEGRRREGRCQGLAVYDAFVDLRRYVELVQGNERLGIFTVGGGVPRNWAQQVGPYTELLERRLGTSIGSMKRYKYAVRICPEPEHWGGLSGCGYLEGVSWGKFHAPSEGGRYAEVKADATIAWPILLRGVLERLGVVGAAPGR